MDVDELNRVFEINAGKLKSYLLRITASIADAEDLVQDTYLKACDKLTSFKGESGLKTWLFTIATNLAKDNLRAQKRWPENVTDIARTSALADETFLKRRCKSERRRQTGSLRQGNILHFALPVFQNPCRLSSNSVFF